MQKVMAQRVQRLQEIVTWRVYHRLQKAPELLSTGMVSRKGALKSRRLIFFIIIIYFLNSEEDPHK